MTGDVNQNRILNTKYLIEINRLTARSFCIEHSLPYKTLQPTLSKSDGRISDSLARDIETGFGIPECSLDEDSAKLLESVDKFRLVFRAEINTLLDGVHYSNRYWNIRRFIASEKITLVQISAKLGIHKVYCTNIFSRSPVAKIIYDMARAFEQAYFLPAMSLEAQAKESPIPKQVLFNVSDEAISYLGTGAYLNRFIHIKDHMIRFNETKIKLYRVFGFNSWRDDNYLADMPGKLISYASARDFEGHFGLIAGSIDYPLDGYDYSGIYSKFTVTLVAFKIVGGGESLYRYVNLRRLMINQGLNLLDLANVIGKTRAYTHSILSDKPVSKIGAKSARNLETALDLEPLSLDRSVAFDLENSESPIKNRLR